MMSNIVKFIAWILGALSAPDYLSCEVHLSTVKNGEVLKFSTVKDHNDREIVLVIERIPYVRGKPVSGMISSHISFSKSRSRVYVNKTKCSREAGTVRVVFFEQDECSADIYVTGSVITNFEFVPSSAWEFAETIVEQSKSAESIKGNRSQNKR